MVNNENEACPEKKDFLWRETVTFKLGRSTLINILYSVHTVCASLFTQT